MCSLGELESARPEPESDDDGAGKWAVPKTRGTKLDVVMHGSWDRIFSGSSIDREVDV